MIEIGRLRAPAPASRGRGKATQSRDGTTAMEITVSVSSDGNTLTETGQAGPTKRVWIFERKK